MASEGGETVRLASKCAGFSELRTAAPRFWRMRLQATLRAVQNPHRALNYVLVKSADFFELRKTVAHLEDIRVAQKERR